MLEKYAFSEGKKKVTSKLRQGFNNIRFLLAMARIDICFLTALLLVGLNMYCLLRVLQHLMFCL